MKKEFTVKSLANGRECKAVYTYEERMEEVPIMDDGLLIDYKTEKKVTDKLKVEVDGKFCDAELHQISSYMTGIIVEICEKAGAEWYIVVSTDKGKLLIPIDEETKAIFDEVKEMEFDPEVAEFEAKAEEKREAAKKERAAEIMRRAETTAIRNEDGSLMTNKEL